MGNKNARPSELVMHDMKASNVKAKIRAIQEEMQMDLDRIGAKHGVKLTIGNGTFSLAGSFTIKVNGVLAGGLTKEEERYDEMAGMLGLPGRGTEFSLPGATNLNEPRRFTIWGINSTGSKLKIKPVNGSKLYWIKVEVVQKIFGVKLSFGLPVQ